MKEHRRLVEGIAAKLAYDYCCYRGNLFGESYLSASVGEIIQSLHGGKNAVVVSGVKHKILAEIQTGGGRRPEIDFVVQTYDDSSDTKRARTKGSLKEISDYKLVATAVETKWADSSHCSIANVIWDLIRLELLVNKNPDMNAVLLIAGTTRAMNKLQGELGSIVSFARGPSRIDLLSKDIPTQKKLAKLLSDKAIADLEMPRAVQVDVLQSSLNTVNPSKMSAILWKVSCVGARNTFKPKDIPEYIAPPKKPKN
ncbi:hypothetical protein GTP58_28915 [Duganella sp. CY15W]|uniref:hypothetical protein n=1 Tax=Duganella sp. CY15W TaxID=2692172 RepID=UPI001367BE25|nr:hypothetical protein [Duganella sp. CY15W]MYM32360.1 hypothetical protein [Duganella sp. CY15W]